MKNFGRLCQCFPFKGGVGLLLRQQKQRKKHKKIHLFVDLTNNFIFIIITKKTKHQELSAESMELVDQHNQVHVQHQEQFVLNPMPLYSASSCCQLERKIILWFDSRQYQNQQSEDRREEID